MDHKLGHKVRLSKFKKIKTISSIFSDHSVTKLEINYNKRTVGKNHKYMESKQYDIKNK